MALDPNPQRLNPIYDALDECNYKFALNQCNKLLKKHPNHLVVKALKSLALERMGQSKEALELCQEIIQQKPAQDAILQATVLTLRSLAKHEMIIELYTNAAEQRPNDEEILNHLFMANVRALNFKGQQQVATTLNKLWKSNRYLFWYLASLVQQGAFGDNTSEASFSMTLAERFLKKCIDDNRIETIDELKLYVIVLEQQEKHQEAYDFLRTEWGDKFKLAAEGDKLRLKFAVRLELWNDVFELCKKLVLSDPNDWDSSKILINAMVHLSQDNSSKIDETKEFIASLLENNESTPIRGPLLAELELLRCLPQTPETTLTLIDRIVGYFKLFGNKLCCLDDIKPFIMNMSDAHITQVLEMLKEASQEDTKSPVDKIYKLLCLEKLKRIFKQDPEEPEGLIEICDKNWQSYLDALQYGESLEVTERQHGDDFVLLIAHRLLSCYKTTENTIYITQAIMILEKALLRSKFNFQFKLLLIRLYLQLGAFKAAFDIYQGMDIKYILHDTVGYFMVDHLSNLGSYVTGPSFLHHSLSIYTNNRRETPEMICQAFKHSTVSKVLEFVRFQKRLENSIQQVVGEHEQFRSFILNIAADCKDMKEFCEKFDSVSTKLVTFSPEILEALRDNRDYDTMNSWEPVGSLSVEAYTRAESIRNDSWIKIRALELATLNSIRSGNNNVESINAALQTVNEEELSCRDKCFYRFCQHLVNLSRNQDVSEFLLAVNDLKAMLLPASRSLNYDTIANITHILEILIHSCVAINGFKIKPESRKMIASLASGAQEWLQSQSEWLKSAVLDENYPELKNQFLLTGTSEPQDFVPLCSFVIDQQNDAFMRTILREKLLESWRRSIKQLMDLCVNISVHFK